MGRARNHLLGWGTSDGGRGREPFAGKRTIFGNMHHLQGDRAICGEWGIIFRERNKLPEEKNNLQREGNHLQIEEKDLKGEGNICNEKEPATKKREQFA